MLFAAETASESPQIAPTAASSRSPAVSDRTNLAALFNSAPCPILTTFRACGEEEENGFRMDG